LKASRFFFEGHLKSVVNRCISIATGMADGKGGCSETTARFYTSKASGLCEIDRMAAFSDRAGHCFPLA
jgi:hypothetical protein